MNFYWGDRLEFWGVLGIDWVCIFLLNFFMVFVKCIGYI